MGQGRGTVHLTQFAHAGRKPIEGVEYRSGVKALALDKFVQHVGLVAEPTVELPLCIDGVEPHVEICIRRRQLVSIRRRAEGVARWGRSKGAMLRGVLIQRILAFATLPDAVLGDAADL